MAGWRDRERADLAWGCFLAGRTDIAGEVAAAVTAAEVLRVAPVAAELLRADGQDGRAVLASRWAEDAAAWVCDEVRR